ncbi:hypothetical protein [Phenylobacterium sp.]|uniref:hypothetical protein n=1 Tax=Phenylobacterium sp. TaxID=1871053 RepID=UPI00391BC7D3
MSLIGKDGKESKDGKEGKEGKDDCGRLAAMDALGIPAGPFDPRAQGIGRKFVRVELSPSRAADPGVIEASNVYWEAVQAYGLLDSVTRTADGATHLVLSVRDEDEAAKLVAQDPGARANAVSLKSRAPL